MAEDEVNGAAYHDAEVAAAVRCKLKAASYHSPGGQDWAALFKRVDKDGSGTIDEAELKHTIRAVLKVLPCA